MGKIAALVGFKLLINGKFEQYNSKDMKKKHLHIKIV